MSAFTRERQGDRTLLDICLAVHMHHTGASDPLSVEHLSELVSILRDACQHWEKGRDEALDFDQSVRWLAEATLLEHALTGANRYGNQRNSDDRRSGRRSARGNPTLERQPMMKLGERPAFPVDVGIHLGASDKGGMTTRTWLAGMALQGLLSNSVALEELRKLAYDNGDSHEDTVALTAMSFADSIINELDTNSP